MDYNHNGLRHHHHQQQQQQQQERPGTLVNVLSVSDLNDNELQVRDDNYDQVAWGVEAVDNGHNAVMVMPGRARETLVITDAAAETYDVDSSHGDVC